MLDFYLNPNTVADLDKKYQRHKIDCILNKYSKDDNSIDEIMDQIEMLRYAKKSPLEQFIAERGKSRKQKAERLKRHKAEELKRQKTGTGC